MNPTGCEDTDTLSIVVYERPEFSFSESICEDSVFMFNGTPLDSTGIYVDTIENGSINGCDSVVVLDLEVIENVVNHVYDTICLGDTLFYNGEPFTTEGMHTITEVGGGMGGCNLIIHIHLEVNEPTVGTLSTEICPGDEILINGKPYSAPGTYVDTLFGVSAVGCDSIVNITIAGIPDTTAEFTTSLCAGDTVWYNGIPYTSQGFYIDTLDNMAFNGCDSILHITIIDLPDTTTTLQASLCSGDTAWYNGIPYVSEPSSSVVGILVDDPLWSQGSDFHVWLLPF